MAMLLLCDDETPESVSAGLPHVKRRTLKLRPHVPPAALSQVHNLPEGILCIQSPGNAAEAACSGKVMHSPAPQPPTILYNGCQAEHQPSAPHNP